MPCLKRVQSLLREWEAYFVDKQKVLNSVDSGIALADRKIGAFANGVSQVVGPC